MDRARMLLRFEIGVAAVCATLFVVTLISSEWIEFVFGVDPDGGDGSLEWSIMAVTAVIAIAAILLARAHWRRLRSVRGSA